MTTLQPPMSADRAERLALNTPPPRDDPAPQKATPAKAAAQKSASPPHSQPVSPKAAAFVGRAPGSAPVRAMAAAQVTHAGAVGTRQEKEAVESAARELNALPAYQRGDALDETIDRFAHDHSRDAAVELVARLAEEDARGLGAALTLARGDDRSAAQRQILADGLARAYERAPASASAAPYVSAREQMARDLAQGLSDGLLPGANIDTDLAELVGRTGDDALQAQFVRSGLYIAASNARGNAMEPSYYLTASLAPAVRDAPLAAQEVIRFAEAVDVPFGSGPGGRGPHSLATVLESFQLAGTDLPNGERENGFITFMRAASSGAVGDPQAFTLFLAVSSNEHLIEADGVGGKSNPEATALTARLFERHYDRWIDPNGMNITALGTLPASGISSKFGGLYDGFDIGGAFTRFFQEALIDRHEKGDYRASVTAFVLDRIFQAYGTHTPQATLLGGSGAAAAHSASLLNLLGRAEGDVLQGLAAASAENQQIVSFLVGGGFAVLGAYTGGPAGAAAGGKAGQALIDYMIGKAEGSITENLSSYLAAQGVDRAQIRAIQQYLGNPAAVAQALQANLGGTVLSAEQLSAFIDTFESHLGQHGTAKALEQALEVLDNDFGNLNPAQRQAIETALRELQQVK